ncbi:hypothetical protein IQ217_01940 [Synechocystis salina LEGE 00031]|uniref:Antitermination protein NusB n=1 Tax=Synechocystis salina LEGE 00031 TaxID=1828736 RepID=A0ABR9VMR1_9SYNC|nr:hypothetical protein [Synechocystis salina LEGE 00041]MBE9252630.1 hypothetical protein [Synechocystis salina LEGE 00031]
MTNLPIATQVIILGTAHCLLGLTATAIAYGKGRNFPRWLAIGLIGGTPALVAAILLKKVSR